LIDTILGLVPITSSPTGSTVIVVGDDVFVVSGMTVEYKEVVVLRFLRSDGWWEDTQDEVRVALPLTLLEVGKTEKASLDMVTRLLYNSIIDKVELMDIIVELLVECLQIEFRMLFDLAVVEIVSS
jgi:hypothetical protein